MAPVKDVSAIKNSFKIIICAYFFEKFWQVGVVAWWLREGGYHKEGFGSNLGLEFLPLLREKPP